MSSNPLIDRLQQQPNQPAHHNGWTIEADNPHTGLVGIQTDALRLRRDKPSTQKAPDLARQVAKRAKYLLEPLKLVEGEAKKALLRSDDPEPNGNQREYYEVWVTPDNLSVKRYQSEKGKRREPCPVNLTWEQAKKFARDVEASYDDKAS